MENNKKVCQRIVIVLFLLPLITGFRLTLFDRFWDISEEDPYVWIKFCDEPDKFSSFNFPEGDALFGTTPDHVEVIQSIINDVNSIETSFIKLELHPDTPNSDGLSPNFDAEKAANRTIHACWGSPIGTHTSHSEEDNINNKVEGCKITIGNRKERHDANLFTYVFSHELGHCLGLAHSQDIRESIMSYHRTGTFIRMQIDDKMGITARYPVAGMGKEDPTFGLQCSTR